MLTVTRLSLDVDKEEATAVEEPAASGIEEISTEGASASAMEDSDID